MRIIGGAFKRHGIFSPGAKIPDMRPTHDRTRENVFNLLSPWLEDAEFLDLFAGCGCMGLEALSRRAKFTTFVDSNPQCAQLIRKNADHLGVGDRTRIVRSDVIRFLNQYRAAKKFDIVYVDPPYKTEHIDKTLTALGKGQVLNPGAIVIGEHFRPPKYEQAGLLKLKDTRRYTGKTSITVWEFEEETSQAT